MILSLVCLSQTPRKPSEGQRIWVDVEATHRAHAQTFQVRVNISNFLLQNFKFVPSPDQIVQDVPNLSLVKIFVEVVPVFYLTAQNEFKFVKS